MKANRRLRRTVRAAFPLFESLQPRRLLSTITVISGGGPPTPPPPLLDPPSDGIIRISGTLNDDRFHLDFSDSEFSVSEEHNRVAFAHYNLPGIAKITIDTRRGNDWIVVGDDFVSVPLPTITFYTGAGNDTVAAGGEADRIFAGDGNDLILADNGRDTVYGEAGDDFLRGAGGSDLLDAGDGRDTIMADAGNDHLYGGANPDHLRGGDGNDDLHGGGGIDFLHGEAGDDFLAGDNGTDQLFPGAGINVLDAKADDAIFDGGLTKTGAGVIMLTANSTYTGTTTISNGTVTVTNGVTLTGGKLDLANNQLIIAGTVNASSYSEVTGLIQSGRNGGGWTGTGIVVSTAPQVSGQGNDTALWAGQTVTGTDTLVMYTYGGDANLDGKVNIDDYGHIDPNIPLGTNGWFNGDFNYDGRVDIDDYSIIDFNIGVQGVPFPQ